LKYDFIFGKNTYFIDSQQHFMYFFKLAPINAAKTEVYVYLIAKQKIEE